MTPRRVIFPLAGLNLSGGVKNLLAQASALARAGHAVRIVLPDYSPTSPFPIDPHIQVSRLATGPAWLPLPLRKLVYFARLSLQSTRHADVCVVAYFPTVYAAVASRYLRRSPCRIVYSVSAYEPTSHGQLAEASAFGRGIRTLLAQRSYRLPVERIYASAWLRSAVGDREGFVLGRGIDSTHFHPHGRGPSGPVLRVGVIGRSGPVKGYATFLEAVTHLGTESRPVFRVVAVDPVPLPQPGPVERLPPLDELGMADFYRGCDIFVFSSHSEGFPAPPLEAMACGCAVVTTDCGGVREYAIPEQNCLIVPVNDPPALARALERLCTDTPLRQRLAQNGISTASRFTRDAPLARLQAFIENPAG